MKVRNQRRILVAAGAVNLGLAVWNGTSARDHHEKLRDTERVIEKIENVGEYPAITGYLENQADHDRLWRNIGGIATILTAGAGLNAGRVAFKLRHVEPLLDQPEQVQ